MYTDQSIDDVIANTDLVDALSQFVTLKKSGSGLKGLSPFAAEKTPSFHVTPSKGMWKCFSSGKGGGGRRAITSFLEEYKGWPWIQSIEWMADLSGVQLEKAQQTAEEKRYREEKPKLEAVLIVCIKAWADALKKDWEAKGPIMQYLGARGYTLDECIKWGMGYAPNVDGFITRTILDRDLLPLAVKAGIVGEKDERNYDTMRNRIMFPIRNYQGSAIGFSGRVAPGNTSKAKYVNTKDTPLFHKNNELYGWDEAEAHMRAEGYALIMEGYTDVHACHRAEWQNAIGSMGTAVTVQHAAKIKRCVDTVVVVGDGDVAGYNMFLKSLPILVQAALEVKFALMPAADTLAEVVSGLAVDFPKLAKGLIEAFPEGITDSSEVRRWIFLHQKEWKRLAAKHTGDKIQMGLDPDELLQKDPDEFGLLVDSAVDGVEYWCASELDTAGANPNAQGQAIENVGAFLAQMPVASVANAYIAVLASQYRWVGKTQMNAVVKQHRDLKETVKADQSHLIRKLPEGVDRDFVDNYGFYVTKEGPLTGYWFMIGDAKLKVSNFFIEPIFHKKDDMDDARIIRIKNNKGAVNIVMMPSDAIVSKEMFLKWCFRYGGFLWTGSTPQLHSVISSIMHEMPVATELKILGYQEEGFFAYQNCIYNGKLTNYNEYGLVEHAGKHFFSPGVSILNKDRRSDDDPYKYDKYLRYVDNGVCFDKWAAKMKVVYKDYAMPAIAFTFMSAFRDIVFRVDKNCPFLYAYGPKSSGKSQIATSVMSVFFHGRKLFQINSGTEFAFFAYLERARNTPAGFNEFDDKFLKGAKENWFQFIKGIYDGEGRMKGLLNKITGRLGITVQEVNSTVMLIGQYLSTRDDNSVPSRSIILTYFERDYTAQEVKDYTELKGWEDEGLTNISAEIIKYRKHVEDHYRTYFFEEMRTIGKLISTEGEKYNERVLRNYAVIVGMWRTFEGVLKLPWSVGECRKWCKEEIVQVSSMITSSDILQQFWAMIESLVVKGSIRKNVHFKVKPNVASQTDINGKEMVWGNQPKDLLFIRVIIIYPEYSDAMRNQPSDTLNKTSLISYLKQRDYYLGQVGKEYFGVDEERTQTSAMVIDWNMLKEMSDITLGEKVKVPAREGVVMEGDKGDDLPF